MSVIIVTALFDINRSVHGDGRKMEDYFEWLNKTLKLNATFVVFTESKFINKIKNMKLNIIIVEQKLEEIPYYKYKKNIQNIINLPEYKKRIEYPDRIECNLELYNVIQYSKFGWLKKLLIHINMIIIFGWMLDVHDFLVMLIQPILGPIR